MCLLVERLAFLPWWPLATLLSQSGPLRSPRGSRHAGQLVASSEPHYCSVPQNTSHKRRCVATRVGPMLNLQHVRSSCPALLFSPSGILRPAYKRLCYDFYSFARRQKASWPQRSLTKLQHALAYASTRNLRAAAEQQRFLRMGVNKQRRRLVRCVQGSPGPLSVSASGQNP